MAEILKARQREILKHLMTHSVPLDVEFFKDKFQKSERTIRYDLNELKEVCKEYGVEIRYQTKAGFFIPMSQKLQCSQMLLADKYQVETDSFMGSEEDRYKMLFLYLFVQQRKRTADQMAEKLYVSRSTFLRMIAKLPNYLEEEIQLISRKTGGYELAGDETKLRKLAVTLLVERFKGSYTADDLYPLLPEPIKELLTQQKFQTINNGIKKINARYNIWLSNIAFLKLLSYCITAEVRHTSGPKMPRGHTERGYAYDLLKEFLDSGETVMKKEVEYLVLILEENGIMVNIREQDEEKLLKALQKTEEFLKEIELEHNKRFDIKVLHQELFDHLKNFLYLWEQGRDLQEENYAVIREVRENYHEFYGIARKCVRVLERELQIEFSDTEVCYIAVYLYKSCQEKDSQKKKVLVVCATGKGLSNLLTIRLQNVFPVLEVVGQVSPYQFSDSASYRNADFIVSTIPLTKSKIPVVQVSRILSAEDIVRIQGFLDHGEIPDQLTLRKQEGKVYDTDEDPFTLSEANGHYDKKNLEYTANVLSKLILTLLEYTSKFSVKYKLSQDALLGLIIHMSMAVPRWYQGRIHQRNTEDCEEEYERMRSDHREVFEIMEKFFELVENSLMVQITIEEKLAFFLYIIKEE